MLLVQEWRNVQSHATRYDGVIPMDLKRTPLFELHRKLGAKLVEFGGWEMPIHYSTGILEEHRAVRESVGVFDVSHMGQIEITGQHALDLVQYLITNDASRLNLDQALYTPMCHEHGGVLDDLLVYRLPDRYLLVVNASTTEKDYAWIQKAAARFPGVHVMNTSDSYSQLAVQGPQAETAVQRHVEVDLSRVQYFYSVETERVKEPVLISRTGYTGEDGFEVYGSPDVIVQLWKDLIKAGVPPIGLGARDSLRFEAAYLLYGHELDEDTTPIEAGLAWTVKQKSVDYAGKDVLVRQKREGGSKSLIGFTMLEPGVPRQGYVLYVEGKQQGYVTSGMKSPTLGEFMGMGYLRVPKPLEAGREIEVEIRGQRKAAKTVKLPFYRGSVRSPRAG
jgi:aminomethyltransferase